MRTWFALLAAPILMLCDQSISYAAAGWTCAHQGTWLPHAVHGTFFVSCAVASFCAWQLFRATPSASADQSAARRHFLAGVATASAFLSALVILAMWLPNWVLSPCFA
jgi:hypothetical protein